MKKGAKRCSTEKNVSGKNARYRESLKMECGLTSLVRDVTEKTCFVSKIVHNFARIVVQLLCVMLLSLLISLIPIGDKFIAALFIVNGFFGFAVGAVFKNWEWL